MRQPSALLISLGLSVSLAMSEPIQAQPSGRVPRVGVLCAGTCQGTRSIEEFVQGLSEVGYVDGRTINIQWREARGRYDHLPRLAAELAVLNVDVIVALSDPSALAAKAAVSTVPVIFVGVGGDPVERGLVNNLSRPSGNLTGVSLQLAELVPKQLELLKELVPSLSRVAVLRDPSASALIMKLLDQAAGRLRINLDIVDLRDGDDLPGAFSTLSKRKPSALLLLPNPTAGANIKRLAELTLKYRLPAIYWSPVFTREGGLIAYGPDEPAHYRRAARYVDRVLRGAKPSELPVEQPTNFVLSINPRSAAALGLAIPPALRQRANDVVE